MKLGSYKREKFYKTLLNLRKFNPALASDASFRKVHLGDDKAVYAYVRQKGDKKALVILNLSAHEQMITIDDDTLLGTAHNVFSRQDEPLTSKPWKMNPWGYAVFTY
jgi:alpha-amylase